MNKKYKSTRKNWLIIPAYGLAAIFDIIFGKLEGTFLFIKLVFMPSFPFLCTGISAAPLPRLKMTPSISILVLE